MSDEDEEEGGQFRDPGGVISRLADAEIASRDEWRVSRTSAEIEHNRRAFGVTYNEVYGRDDHRQCIILCLDPGQRRPVRCPCCYKKAAYRGFDEMPEIEPIPTRGERLAEWIGACMAAFWTGLTAPLRVSQEHRVALIRDVIQDAMAAGLTAEVVQICPVCAAAEDREVAISEAGERA
jgi:hypothetical protein